MFLDVFSDNPFATNCWAFSADGSDDAVVVDPGFEPDQIREMVSRSGRRLAAVLATHGHIDHIAAVPHVCSPDVPLYIHEADELALTDQRTWGAGMPVDADLRPEEVRTLSGGDVLEFAGFRIQVVHTPGHTPGSVCYVTDGILFSGDLVFRGSIGRHDFPNSSEPDMWASLRRFLALPDSLVVYPGHGPETTVGVERISNEWLVPLAGARD
jgi:glyoxylase-like metal-dependent hydrolase (beta-lactamase superfamily II)